MLNQTTPTKICKTHTLNQTEVVDSRREGGGVRRRRKCKKCGVLIYTEEKIIRVGKSYKKPPKPKVVRLKSLKKKPARIKKPRFEDLDIDSMSDDELEAWITRGE